MLGERIRHTPLLSFEDAASLFDSAMTALSDQTSKSLLSMSAILDAYEAEIATAIADGANAIVANAKAPPWAKTETRRAS
jgi:hypothetical protein